MQISIPDPYSRLTFKIVYSINNKSYLQNPLMCVSEMHIDYT